MNLQTHWETVYRTKNTEQVSWYAPHLEISLQLIQQLAPERSSAILDVGAGASTLVDDLLSAGYQHLDVLDISCQALSISQQRLGIRAQQVRWWSESVLDAGLPSAHYDVWHDRAVFHFLTEEKHRRQYVQQVLRAVKPGGSVVMATFGTEGPLQCSGLDVMRYDAVSLHGEFGRKFRLLDSLTVNHHTPVGKTQQFLYCYCRVDNQV